MSELSNILAVSALMVMGIILGRGTARLKSPWWLTGYLGPMLLICIVAASRLVPAFSFQAPFRFITGGRREFALMAVAITMMFMTLLPHLGNRRTRRLLFCFMLIAAPYFSLTPFVGPLLVRQELKHLPMQIMPGGICIQGTGYTCGPAAMVTALWQLGIQANEGQLAIKACTNPFSGTPEDLLIDAVQTVYGPLGVKCSYCHFDSIDQLRQSGLTVALIHYSFMVDHYVTVLEVGSDTILIADPAQGPQRIPLTRFEQTWKNSGIVIQRRNFFYHPPSFHDLWPPVMPSDSADRVAI